jgi:hypothetical protein
VKTFENSKMKTFIGSVKSISMNTLFFLYFLIKFIKIPSFLEKVEHFVGITLNKKAINNTNNKRQKIFINK